MFVDAFKAMGFYFPFLERRQSSNKNMGWFFKIKRMAVKMEAETEGHSVEKSDCDGKE